MRKRAVGRRALGRRRKSTARRLPPRDARGRFARKKPKKKSKKKLKKKGRSARKQRAVVDSSRVKRAGRPTTRHRIRYSVPRGYESPMRKYLERWPARGIRRAIALVSARSSYDGTKRRTFHLGIGYFTKKQITALSSQKLDERADRILLGRAKDAVVLAVYALQPTEKRRGKRIGSKRRKDKAARRNRKRVRRDGAGHVAKGRAGRSRSARSKSRNSGEQAARRRRAHS